MRKCYRIKLKDFNMFTTNFKGGKVFLTKQKICEPKKERIFKVKSTFTGLQQACGKQVVKPLLKTKNSCTKK